MKRIWTCLGAAVVIALLCVALIGDRPAQSQVGPGSPFTLLATPLNGTNAATNNISGYALTNSPRALGTCGGIATVATSGTDTANAAATDTYVAEIDIPYNVITTGVAIFNGGTQNGNDNIWLTDGLGHQLLATAATAASGASSYQRIPWTAGATAIQGPGTYYLLFQNSGTSNDWRTWAVGNCGTALLTGGTNGTFPTFTAPPTTFTTVQGPIASLY